MRRKKFFQHPLLLRNIAKTLPMYRLINTLEFRGNDSPTWNNMKLVHWPLIDGLLYLVQRGWDCMGRASARPGPSLPLYQM